MSVVVIDELRRTKGHALRQRLLDVLVAYPILMLPDGGEEVGHLARAYMAREIVPARNPEDALHVAHATIFELDVPVTWNYRHLARARTTSLVASANMAEGYPRPLQILTPLEVLQL